MTLLARIKILPILIVVAMLAFSVRLVEFSAGVSSLTGVAHAEVEQPSDAGLDAPTEEAMDGEEIAMDDAADMEEDAPEWRDAGDDELDYSSMKMELFDDMADRRKELDKREKQLMTREALLLAAEKELDRKYQELSALRSEIENLLQRQSEEEEARINSLVKIYENMKPKDAARIFDTLDLDVLMSVMGRMSERKLSPVMAEMNPERARTITIMLAEEKKLPSLPQVDY